MPEYEQMDWAELGPCAFRIAQVKPISQTTVVGEGGRCGVQIVCPDAPEYCDLAYRIQEFLTDRAGISPAVRRPHQVDTRVGGDHLIALGNLNTNPLLADLYHAYYVAADAAYPGKGGYVVRTVCDPWGVGRDVLALGGSDIAGVAKAKDRFLDLVRQDGDRVWVDRVIDAAFGSPFRERCEGIALACTAGYREQMIENTYRRLEEGQHRGATPNVAHAGLMYNLTGDEGFARLYLELFKIMYQDAVNDTGKGPWSPWGFDADFQSVSMMQAWDLVEHAPVFSDRDRLYITNHLIDYLGNNEKHAVNHRPRDAQSCRHNHYTFACLGLLFGAKYFGKTYDYPDVDRWLDLADECFVPQAEAFKANEDCNSYQWLTFAHMIRYAFVRPDPTFIENGRARLCLDLGVATMDNLGYQAPYGDCASYKGSFSEVVFYKTVAWALRDPMYRDVLARKQALVSRYSTGGIDPVGYQYEIDFESGRPMQMFFGGAAVPLDPRYYYTFEGDKQIPQEQAFDKVVFREDFDPEGDYLLLDGLSNGGHKHYDGNAIVRLTSADRIWLADADYMKAPLQFHNTVVISHDGESQLIPDYTALDRVANLGNVAYSSTTVSDYTDADWTRHIFWEKEKYFLVVDRVCAQQPGDYDLLCLWRGVGDVSVDVARRRMTILQGDKRFRIEAAAGHAAEMGLKLIHEPMIWATWDQYPYCGESSDLKVLRERMRLRLDAGEEALFFNLLGTEGKMPSVSMNRLSEGLIALEGDGGRRLMGTRTGLEGLEGVATDAAFAQLSADRLALIQATYLRLEDRPIFESERPVDIAVDLDTLRGVVSADGDTRLIFPLGLMETAGGDVATEIAFPAGKGSFCLADGAASLQEDVRRTLDAVTGSPPDFSRQIQAPPSGCPMAKLDAVWSAQLPDGARPRCVAAADVDGDGADELLVGTEEGAVFCVCKGEILWQHAADGRINALACADVDGDGRPEVIAGSADHHVYLLGADGAERWRFEVPPYMHEPVVKTVLSADLGLDKGRAVVAGANSCHFHAISPEGEELWRYEVIHGSNHGCAVDFDGDGVDEILAVTEWWPWHCINAQGKGRWPHWSVRANLGPGANVVAAGDVDGDGELEMVCGGIDSCVYVFGRDGKLKWQYYTGEEVLDLVCQDTDGDGRAEVFAGSHNGALYRLDGDGRMVWNRFLGNEVQTVRIGAFGGRHECELVAGTRGNILYHMDLDGRVLRAMDFGEPIRRIETVSLPEGTGIGIAAVSGRVAVWDVART